jgi:hypothetical protein
VILIQADYETAERIGALGTFQVISVTVDGVDSTNKVDQGKHYHSGEEVVVDLGYNPATTDWSME